MSELKVAGTNVINVEDPSDTVIVGNMAIDPETQASGSKVDEYSPGDGYEKIEIPDSLVYGEQPDQETEQAVTTESQDKATTVSEQKGETETVSDDSEIVYKSEDGTEHTATDIETWKTDSVNRSEWQKSNTEKAQEISEARKSVEPFMKLMEKFRESDEFADTVKEAVIDELGDEAGQLFEQSLEMKDMDKSEEPETTVEPEEVSELKAKNRQLENEMKLGNQLSELMNKHGLNDKEVDSVLSFAVGHQEKTGTLLSPEDAYKVMNFDKVKSGSKNKPSVPVNVKKGVGVKSNSSKKSFTSYEDIDINGFFN